MCGSFVWLTGGYNHLHGRGCRLGSQHMDMFGVRHMAQEPLASLKCAQIIDSELKTGVTKSRALRRRDQASSPAPVLLKVEPFAGLLPSGALSQCDYKRRIYCCRRVLRRLDDKSELCSGCVCTNGKTRDHSSSMD